MWHVWMQLLVDKLACPTDAVRCLCPFVNCQNIIQHSVASFFHHILLRCIFCRAPIPCFTYDNYLNSWAKPNDPFPETPCGNCPVHHESSAPGFPDECEAPGHKDESKKIQKITNSRTRSAKTGPRNMQTWAISLSQAVGRIKIFELKINWVPSWQRQTLKRLFPSCLKASASPSICVNGSKSSDVEWHDNDKACPICESTSAISNLAKFTVPGVLAFMNLSDLSHSSSIVGKKTCNYWHTGVLNCTYVHNIGKHDLCFSFSFFTLHLNNSSCFPTSHIHKDRFISWYAQPSSIITKTLIYCPDASFTSTQKMTTKHGALLFFSGVHRRSVVWHIDTGPFHSEVGCVGSAQVAKDELEKKESNNIKKNNFVQKS